MTDSNLSPEEMPANLRSLGERESYYDVFFDEDDGRLCRAAADHIESQAAKIAELQSQRDFFERTGKKFENIIVELRQRNKELENKVGELPSPPPDSTQERLAKDRLMYGSSYSRIDADGTVTRLDPSTVMIAPQPADEPGAASNGQ